MSDLVDLLHYPIMQHMLYASFLASITCGIVGTLVVCNRLTFLAGGASHAAYGGIGVALFFQWPVLLCTLVFSVFAALIMGVVTLQQERLGVAETNTDVAIGVLWASGMAFGIILIQLTPGYSGELMGFLVGGIASVPWSDIVAMLIFNGLLIVVVLACRQGLWAVSLDRDFARSRGLPVNVLYLLIVGIAAVAVVMLIRVVGLILVLALLTIPSALARRLTKKFFWMMVIATTLSFVFCVIGLLVSWNSNLSPGASIVAIGTCGYFVVLLWEYMKKKLGWGHDKKVSLS